MAKRLLVACVVAYLRLCRIVTFLNLPVSSNEPGRFDRLQGQTLFPISEWPPSVYVVRLLNKSIVDQHEFDYSQTQLIDWGVLYRTYDDALEGK